jgi:type VI secretion system VasD/TssJ family lipoprotein
MRHSLRFLFIGLSLLALFSGCINQKRVFKPMPKEYSLYSKPGPDQPNLKTLDDNWVFQKKGIVLKVDPKYNLNLYQGKPHALQLNIYQMADPTGFNKATRNKVELRKLLNTEILDPASGILTFESVIVYPSQEQRIVLNRAETAKYIGVVAAYYDLHPTRCVTLKKIPVSAQVKPNINPINPISLIQKGPPPLPDTMFGWLELGHRQIDVLTVHGASRYSDKTYTLKYLDDNGV